MSYLTSSGEAGDRRDGSSECAQIGKRRTSFGRVQRQVFLLAPQTLQLCFHRLELPRTGPAGVAANRLH